MSNIIDSIQLSGSSYDVRDKSATTVVEITQSDYDNLPSSAKTSNILYIITDGSVDYITSGQCQTQIDNSISGKQDTLVSGTNIKTINNESLLGSGNIDIQGGGGKAVTGGTNISVVTGETADTINCTLPIVMKGTNMRINSTKEFGNSLANCFTFGGFNTVGGGSSCSYLVTFGSDNDMSADGSNRRYRYAFGTFLKTQNHCEIAFSKYNVSSSASTTFGDSGNTLFSVGNGTSNSARHNAFEIRQNGDIYITSGGTDIKLQDNLGGGGGSSYTAGTGIDITNDIISVSGVVMSSAITTSVTSSSTDAQVPSAKAVNDKLGGLSIVKLSQSEYDSLATKDNSTLYVIVN